MNALEMKEQMMAYLRSLDFSSQDAEECLLLYFSTFGSCVAQIRSGLEHRDIPLIRTASHTLAGSSGTIGAKEIERRVIELNTFAKASDFVRAEECFRRLEEIYESLSSTMPDHSRRADPEDLAVSSWGFPE